MRDGFCHVVVVLCALLWALPASAQSTTTYTYDELGRITGANTTASSTTYTYDAAGNRTLVNTNAAGSSPTGTFTASASAITAGTSVTLTWTSSNASSASIDNGVGGVAVPNGSVTVTPAATTTYTLALVGAGGRTNLQATVTINTANRAPVANDDHINATAGRPCIVTTFDNDSDPDGDQLTITAYSQGRLGSVSKNRLGRLVYSAPQGARGADQFTYTISDGHGHTATATVYVTVTEVPID